MAPLSPNKIVVLMMYTSWQDIRQGRSTGV